MHFRLKYSYFKPLQGIVEYLRQMGHNMSQIDPYFDHTGYYGGRVQAIATNEYNILTANNDWRKMFNPSNKTLSILSYQFC